MKDRKALPKMISNEKKDELLEKTHSVMLLDLGNKVLYKFANIYIYIHVWL